MTLINSLEVSLHVSLKLAQILRVKSCFGRGWPRQNFRPIEVSLEDPSLPGGALPERPEHLMWSNQTLVFLLLYVDLNNKIHRRGSLSSYLKCRANVSLFPFLCEFPFQTQCRCIQLEALFQLEVVAVSRSKFRESNGHRLLFPVQCSDFCHEMPPLPLNKGVVGPTQSLWLP